LFNDISIINLHPPYTDHVVHPGPLRNLWEGSSHVSIDTGSYPQTAPKLKENPISSHGKQ